MPRAADRRASDIEIVDGEYIRPQQDENVSADAERMIEQIAWLMDRSISLGGVRVGLDPLLGLIPGLGDVFSSLISTVIIVQAHRAGVPKATVVRMMVNVGIDTAAGAVPVVGDVFDFAWKANTRNLELYRRSVRGQRRSGQDWAFLGIILICLAVLVAIPILLAVWMLRAIF